MQRPRFVSLAAIAATLLAIAADARAGAPEDLASVAPDLDPRVLELALRAASCAERRGLLATPETLTVIDYTRPSTEPRLWVLDLARRALLHEELVAHGRGTGDNHAERFSNDPGSHQSSLGLFVTQGTYAGKHGRSLRLQGLEAGVNDRALERAIVMHGAAYVANAFASVHGRLGRSWGCPALAFDVAQRVIDRIRGGSPLFAYYPDSQWLADSEFLATCSDTRPADASSDGTPPRS